MVSWLAKIHQSDVCGHTRTASERKVCMLKRGKLALEGKSTGVATAGIVEDYRLTGGWLCKGGREVEWDADSTKFLARFRSAMDRSRRNTTIEQIEDYKPDSICSWILTILNIFD